MSNYFILFLFIVLINKNNSPNCAIELKDNCKDSLQFRIDKLVSSIELNKKNVDSLQRDIYPNIIDTSIKNIFRHGLSKIIMYYNNSDTLQTNVIYEGDRETYTFDFFYYDNHLIFIRKKYELFDPPKWEKKSKPIKTENNSYYFQNEIIVLYIKDKHIIKLNKKDIELLEKSLIYENKKYKYFFYHD